MHKKKHSKRKGYGKRKGSAFERKICKLLSLWWSEGKEEYLFWRSAGSGSVATVAARKGKRASTQIGDICAIDTRGQPLMDVIAIECKHYRDLGLLNLFQRSPMNSIAVKGYDKLARQLSREKVRKFPVAIVKGNSTKVLLLCDRKLHRAFAPVNPVVESGKFSFYLLEEVLRKRSADLFVETLIQLGGDQ